MRKLLALFLASVLFFSPTVLAEDDAVEQEEFLFTQYFDTSIEITLYHDDADLESIEDSLESRLSELHDLAPRYDETDVTNIKTINDNPGVAHEVDDDLFEMVRLGVEYHDKTNGYFNIALGPVIDIWNELLERGVGVEIPREDLPSEETLEAAGAHTDVSDITLDEEAGTIRIEEGMSLDLGGIAKGYAAREGGNLLKQQPGVDSFVFNAGTSNIEVYGEHPQRESGLWHIPIVDPAYEGDIWSIITGQRETFAEVHLADGENIVGSGNYERYVTVDDVPYHHLIDPFTYLPAGVEELERSRGERIRDELLCRTELDHFLGAWLIHDDPLIGDILVTAAYLMPIEDALDFIEEIDDTEGIFYGADDRIFRTSGFDGELYDDDFSDPDDRAPCLLPIVLITGGFILAVGGTLLVMRIRNRRKKKAAPRAHRPPPEEEE